MKKTITAILVFVILLSLCFSTVMLAACKKTETPAPQSGAPDGSEGDGDASPSVFVQGEGDISVGILADIHVMAETQAVDMTCDDFKSWEAHGQKMLGLSESILKTTVDRIIAESDFDVVLVSGDNADDGGKTTHEVVARELARLEDAGIKVFTIPGNHDINNKSYTYASGSAAFVDSVTESDFAEIYASFGYDGEGIVEYYNSRTAEPSFEDGDNLSYVADLSDEYRLIAIDMSKHASTYSMTVNGKDYPLVESRHDGAMTEDLLAWAEAKTREAIEDGKIPLGMMHFPLIQHFGSLVQAENAAVNDPGRSVAAALADAGMKFIFTGHIHIQDDALYTSPAGNKILDVNSASLCNYPMPVRYFRAKGEEAEIRTWQMNVIDEKYLPVYLTASEKSAIKKDFVAYSIAYLDGSMLAKIKNKIEEPMMYSLLSVLGVKKNGTNDAQVTALAKGIYEDLFLKFLALPLYEKDAADGASVEGYVKRYGGEMPASKYTTVFNLAMSFVAGMYGGDECCTADDDRIEILEYAIYSAFALIADYDFLGKVRALNPDFAEINLEGSLEDLFSYGDLEIAENNLLVGLLSSLNIPILKKYVNVDENSNPYDTLDTLLSLVGKMGLEDMLFGLHVDEYILVFASQKTAFISLGTLLEDVLPSSLLLGLANDTLKEGSTYAYRGGVTDSAPADNDMKINMNTMAYEALK